MVTSTKSKKIKNWMKAHSFEIVSVSILSLVSIASMVVTMTYLNDDEIQEDETFAVDPIDDGTVVLTLED